MRNHLTLRITSLFLVVFMTACGGTGSDEPYNLAGPSGNGGAGTIGAAGGIVTTDLVDVSASADALPKDVNIIIAPMDIPSGVPPDLTPIGKAVDISVSDPAAINSPLRLTIKYNDTGIVDEKRMSVLHYNENMNNYEPVTILAHDKEANTITFESRSFSLFVVVLTDKVVLPTAYITNFDPSRNGWGIDNFGSYFAPNGNCLGMASYATWFYRNRSEDLSGFYSISGLPSIASLVAQRAHIAQSQTWANVKTLYFSSGSLLPNEVGEQIKLALYEFKQPLVLLAHVSGTNYSHAVVVYGYDENGFIVYDVNERNSSNSISYDGQEWGTYPSPLSRPFDQFSYLAAPSLGRDSDFVGLTSQAESAFTYSNLISITTPAEGQQVAEFSSTLSGTLSGDLSWNSTLIAFVKGERQIVPVNDGKFSVTIPVAAGDNSITLLAGVDTDGPIDQILSLWYPNAATLIRTIQGTHEPTKLLVTLSWEQDNTDVDLYVTEPAPSGQTAWYSSTGTTNGLVLDFDNTVGYGPEHISLVSLPDSSNILSGDYIIRVHYFSDHGTGKAVTGKVAIVVNEGAIDAQYAEKKFEINASNMANDVPSSIGEDWVDIGTVNLVNGTITLN